MFPALCIYRYILFCEPLKYIRKYNGSSVTSSQFAKEIVNNDLKFQLLDNISFLITICLKYVSCTLQDLETNACFIRFLFKTNKPTEEQFTLGRFGCTLL